MNCLTVLGDTMLIIYCTSLDIGITDRLFMLIEPINDNLLFEAVQSSSKKTKIKKCYEGRGCLGGSVT